MEVPQDRPLEVAYFFSPTCRECLKTKPVIDSIKQKWGTRIRLRRFDVQTNKGLETLLGYEDRHPGTEGAPPKVYLAGRALQGFEAIQDTLDSAIRAALDTQNADEEPPSQQSPDPDGRSEDQGTSPSRSQSKPGEKHEPQPDPDGQETSFIQRKFQSFSIGTIAVAGLIDGVNPCAFATIVFLITMLTKIGSRRRQVVLAGLSFTAAVFVTYFLLGIGLLNLVKNTVLRWGLDVVLIVAIACLTFLLAIWSLRDGIKMRTTGKIPEHSLGLPKSVSKRIHTIMRENLSTRRLILGTLFVGFLVSLLESVCTGQVYVPTIMLVLKTPGGRLAAMGYLLLYNFMFILPLIVVMLAVYLGVASDRLRQIARSNLATMKFVLAGLFLLLGGLLLATL